MNKKIIVFICILSLLVPFLPQFDFVVRASVPSTSEDFAQWIDDNFYEVDGVIRPKTQAPLYMKVNWALTDAGYVLKDPVSAVVDSLQSATNLQLLTKENLMGYGQTINYDYSSLSNNIVNNSITYASDNLSYYIYDFININNFFNYYNFSNYNTYLSNYVSVYKNTLNNPDLVYFVSQSDPTTANYLGQSAVLSVSRNFFDDNYLCLNSGQFSIFPSYNYQTVRIPGDLSSINSLPNGYLSGSLDFYNSGSGFLGFGLSDFSFLVGHDNFRTFYFQSYLGVPSKFAIRCGCVNDSTGNMTNRSTIGTIFITGGDAFSIPVFKSSNLISDFLSGNANVYSFNGSVNLPEGADIDYNRLYDIISNEVSHSSGNVIDAINGVANDYLQEQLDLLHDINNALNDGTGQSWLRRIYGLLDYNFPLTLQAFEDLQHAIQNISISGGGSDLTHINRVLDEINDKLGFMIEEPLTNADVEDFNDLKNLAQQKFPFCVFSDIVAISVILNQTPEQPHWQIPLKLPGSESVNNIEVDLSWYEDVRGLVQGVFIFIFIVGLLVLSVKVFNALKS